MKHETDEIKELEARLNNVEGKLREYESQGRLLLAMGLAITGFVGWMWGDHIKMMLHKILG